LELSLGMGLSVCGATVADWVGAVVLGASAAAEEGTAAPSLSGATQREAGCGPVYAGREWNRVMRGSRPLIANKAAMNGAQLRVDERAARRFDQHRAVGGAVGLAIRKRGAA
jgi:hypothetical protein